MSKRLFIDMDGTLARFHDQVNFLERMWEQNFFRDLEPFQTMVDGVRSFMRQHPDVEVYILSSKILGEPPYCEAEKNAWLDKWLPEIDAAHRIFPAVGTSKADCVEGGVTKDDYLLDDYNKSLRQFEAAGGSAVKCHNNINQRGVGAYGGDRGERWEGAMVHTEDRGEMVAAELAQHMGLDYDLNSVFRTYKVQQIHNSTTPLLDSSHYFIREVPKGIWRTYGSSNSRIFKNPLNAIRSIAGDRGFDEVPPVTYEPPSRATDVGRMTKAQLADLAFNLKISDGHIPRFHSPDEDWAELANEANTVRAYKAYNPHKDPDAIQRAAESACALQKQQVSAGLEADAADITE